MVIFKIYLNNYMFYYVEVPKDKIVVRLATL